MRRAVVSPDQKYDDHRIHLGLGVPISKRSEESESMSEAGGRFCQGRIERLLRTDHQRTLADGYDIQSPVQSAARQGNGPLVKDVTLNTQLGAENFVQRFTGNDIGGENPHIHRPPRDCLERLLCPNE